jgi:beta-lactamase regulating signal transducer with metallopeptidase domain
VSAALLDHLWQSSLVAFCAWMLTIYLRNHSARLRHAIWLCASLKFLIPFSLLAVAGGYLKSYAVFQQMPALMELRDDHFAGLFVMPAARMAAGAPVAVEWLRFSGIVWGLGVVLLMARWCLRWRRIRGLVRSARPSAVVAPIPVLTSPTLREPGVIGIIRPVLLLPAGIETRLTAQQLQAILTHELSHVRRRDNLTSAIHMLVEALFWFFPLVWWIGARILDERERACDEAVLQSGNDPRAYAEGILKVCRTYWASELPCVAGVSGADLKQRLEAIMKNTEKRELSRARKLVLGVVATSALAVPIGMGLAAADSSSTRAAESGAQAPKAGQVGKIVLLAGKRVKLDYRNVDVRSLLRAMADAAQVNMLVSDQVTGSVTVSLAETSWEQALDIVLHSQGLVKREQDGILFVEPASNSKAS